MHRNLQISPEMFNRVQGWSLSGPLEDIHSMVLQKPILCYLSCVLKVVVLLVLDEDLPPTPESKVQSTLEQVVDSVHCCIHLALYPD